MPLGIPTLPIEFYLMPYKFRGIPILSSFNSYTAAILSKQHHSSNTSGKDRSIEAATSDS